MSRQFATHVTTIYDIFCPVPFLPSPFGFRRIKKRGVKRFLITPPGTEGGRCDTKISRGCSATPVLHLPKRYKLQEISCDTCSATRVARQGVPEILPEGPARQIDVSRQKLSPHCLEAILTRSYPRPNCLIKCLPNCLSPTKERAFYPLSKLTPRWG